MSNPTFGKQKKTSDKQPKPATKPADASGNTPPSFWGGETSKDDTTPIASDAKKLSTEQTTTDSTQQPSEPTTATDVNIEEKQTTTETIVESKPADKVEADLSSDHNPASAIPSSDQLLKPFETASTENPIESSDYKPETENPTSVAPPAQISKEADDESYATFSRPDEPVALKPKTPEVSIDSISAMPPPPPKIVRQANNMSANNGTSIDESTKIEDSSTEISKEATPVKLELEDQAISNDTNSSEANITEPTENPVEAPIAKPISAQEYKASIEAAPEPIAAEIEPSENTGTINSFELEDIKDASEAVENTEDLNISQDPAKTSLEENISEPMENISENLEAIATENSESTISPTNDDIDNNEIPAETIEATEEETSSEELTAASNYDANTTNEDALQTLVSEHQKWLDTNGAEGRRAVFKEGVIPAEYDLSNHRLSGASFRGLNLSGCKFAQAQLNEADFTECNLEGADFTNSNLDLANFTQTNANNAIFAAAQINKANFSDSQLKNSNFSHAHMQETNFRDANISGANLEQTTANLANFRKAQIDNANLSKANLSQAILRDANISHSNLQGANLLQTNLRDAVMHNVNLNSTDFSQAVELSSEMQAEFMNAERNNLQKEMEKLDNIRDDLEQRERALISEREQLQRKIQSNNSRTPETTTNLNTGDIAKKLKSSGTLFLTFGIVWLILCFLLAIILESVFAQLDNNDLSLAEMLILGTLMLVPLIFFVISMAKSFSLSNALKKLSPNENNDN